MRNRADRYYGYSEIARENVELNTGVWNHPRYLKVYVSAFIREREVAIGNASFK